MGFRFIKNKKEEEELISRGKELSRQYEENRQRYQEQAKEELKNYKFVKNANNLSEALKVAKHNYGTDSQEYLNALTRYNRNAYGMDNPTFGQKVNSNFRTYLQSTLHPVDTIKGAFGNQEALQRTKNREYSTWDKIQQQTEQFNNIANEWRQSQTVGDALNNTGRLLNVGLGIAKNYGGMENNTGVPLSDKTIEMLNNQKPIFDNQGMVANYRDKNVNLPMQIDTSQNVKLPTKNLEETRKEEREKDSVAQELIKKADINKSDEQLEGIDIRSLARANELSEMMDNGQTASALLQRFQEDVTGRGGQTIKDIVSVVPMVAEGLARVTGDEQAVQDLIDLRHEITRSRFNTGEIRSGLKSVREAQGKGGVGNNLLYVGSNVVDNLTGQITAGMLSGGAVVTNPTTNYTTALMSAGAIGSAFNEREQKQGVSNQAYIKNAVASTLEGIWNGVLEEATGGTFATKKTITDSAGKTVVENSGWLDKLVFNQLAKRGIVNTKNMALVNGIWKYAGEVVEEVGTDLFTAITNQIAGEKFSDNFNYNKEKETIMYTLLTTVLMNRLGMGGIDTEQFAKQYNVTEEDIKKLKTITDAVLDENGLSETEAKEKLTNKLDKKGIDVNNLDKTIETVNQSENNKASLLTMAKNLNISEEAKSLIRDIATDDGIITKQDYDNVVSKIKDILKTDTEIQQAQMLQDTSIEYDNLENQKKSLDDIKPENYTDKEHKRYYATIGNQPRINQDILNTVLNAYPPNRNGRRTVKAWKNVARNLGEQLAVNGKDFNETRQTVVQAFQDLISKDTISKYDSETKKTVGFDKLNKNTWSKEAYEGYKNAMRFNIQQQQDNMYDNLNNQMLDMQDKINVLINTIDDYTVDTTELDRQELRQNLVESAEKNGYKGKSLDEIQALMEKRGIKSRFDKNAFVLKDSKGYVITDEQGNPKYDTKTGAFYDPNNNEIVFNPNASEKEIIQELAVHEWYHELRENNKKEADTLLKNINKYIRKLDGYEEARKNLEDTYASQGYDRNADNFADMIDEEATAKVLQQVLGSEEEIQRLNNYNRNLARRIYDAVVNLLNKFTGGRNEKLFWTNVRNNFERVFNTPGTAKENNQSNNQKRLSTNTESQKQGSFNLPKNVEDIQNTREFLRKAVENETDTYWKEQLKEAQRSAYEQDTWTRRESPLKWRRGIIQQYLDYKNEQTNLLTNPDIRYSVNTSGEMQDNNEYNNVEEVPKFKKSIYNYRPNPRKGWDIDRIQKELKSEYSIKAGAKELAKYDNIEDLIDNIYYHGSISSHDHLKAGSTLKEEQRTGGYGEAYHTISLSKSKNIASNFASMGSEGTVTPVLLRKDANVISMPQIEDSIELEDILPELWNKNVDAVKIGDWNIEDKGYGEQEIVILNPNAIATMGYDTTYFKNYGKPKFQNMTNEEISNSYNEYVDRAIENLEYKIDKLENTKPGESFLYKTQEEINNAISKRKEEIENYKKLYDKFKPNDSNIKYSVSTSGEMQDNNGNKVTLEGETGNSGKTLLALHNLTEDKFKGILELGGFPVPSIAITNPDIVNHSQFGDISVIFNKNTINPEADSRNEVYDRDVWSPVFPQVEYDINNSDIKKYITDNLDYDSTNDIIRDAVTRYMYSENLSDLVNRRGVENAISELKDNKSLKYLYKTTIEKGDYQPITKEAKYNKNYSNESLKRFIDNYNEDMSLADYYYHYFNYQDMKLSDNELEQLKDKIIKAITPEIEADLEKDIKNKNIDEKTKAEYLKEYLKIERTRLDNNYFDVSNFIRDASTFNDKGTQQVIDEHATLNDISNHINQEEYEKWIDNTFGKLLKNAKKGIRNDKDLFTPSGNRRSFDKLHDDYNLQNIVNYMISQDTKGGEGGFMSGGFGEIQAKQGNKFDSISEIKANENKLVLPDEANKQLEPLKENIHNDIEELSNYYKSSSYYNNSWENSASAISEFSGKSNLTESNFKRILNSYYNFEVENIPKELYSKIINDLKNLKNISTDYFEAKPQRAVTFDEIDTVVLPSDTSADIKQQLTDRGINYIEYDRTDENARNNILKSLDQYKFSKKSQDFDSWIKDNIGKYADKGKRTTLGELKVPTKKEAKVPIKQVKLSENTVETTPTETETYEKVPTKNNQKQRKAYKSIIESEFTSKEAKQIAYDYLNSDTYVPDSNKEQLERADKRIERNGIENELASLETNVNEGKKITADDIAVGDRLIKYYMTTGDKANLERSIRAMAMAGTQAGRTVQAFAMIRHQSPEGMAIWIQNSVDKLNSNLKGKQQFEFTPEMQEKILNSNSENLQQNVDEVMKELGQQVPVDFLGKLDAWRYFSMLGNPKTHIRNIVGNFAMAQTQKVKSKIAGTIEQVTGQDRTHTSIFERRNRKAIEFAKQDFQNADVKALLGIGTSKYTNPKNMIQQNQRTFKSDLLEKTLGRLFNINDKLLEGEDNFGLKNAYIRNLSDYMTANKLTAENMTGEQLQQARKMAVEESLRATFHQASALATTLNQIEQKNLFSRVAMGGLVPFKKTPINVAKTGFTYSPVGLAKTILSDTVKLRQGKINVNEYIDNLSQGLTGTGIALLGYGLAEAGILKAGGDDDKEDKYKQAMGDQPYAITINGKSYSLDWLAPSGIPLFVGAELNKLVKDRSQQGEEEADTINELERVSRLFDASATLLNPMSEMSMISGLTSTLQTFATDPGQGLMNLGINPIKSYVSQMAPTSLGQVARSTDEYERDTSSTAKGMIAKAVDSTKNQVMNKIPGLRQKLPTKKDIWGEEVKTQDYFHNAVLPYTKKEVKTNAVDKELNALYEKTGENIYPTTSLNKDVTYEGSKTRLTNKDYNEFKEAYGKNSYRILNSLVNSSEYKGMTDEQKVKAIKDVYTYANDLNKTNYANKKGISFETPTDVQQVNAIKQNGGSEADYFKYKGMVQGLSKDSEKMTTLKNSKLSTNSKTAIYESILGKDDDFYQSTDNLLNINEYLGYKTAGLTSDKDENGKTIKNSLKNNKAEWINQNISGYENRLLLMAEDYKLSRAEQETLLGYINMQSNAEDIFNLLDKNYTVKDGRVYYK